MPITLQEGIDRFTGKYGNNPSETRDNINLVLEWFFSQGNWRGTKGVAQFTLYPYTEEGIDFKQFTLDRSMLTAKAARFINDNGRRSSNFPIQNWWFQWTNQTWWFKEGYGSWHNGGIQYLGDGWATFRDWDTDCQLRVRTDTALTGSINLRGLDPDGNPINNGEGETLDISSNPATTTATFRAFTPIQVVKTPTNGVVKLYSWDGVTETLVGYYYPSDKVISYSRFGVGKATRQVAVEAACTRRFVPLVFENDVIWPDNIMALEWGLLALNYTRSTDNVLAEQYWTKAMEALNGALAQEQGNAQPQIKIFNSGFGQDNLFQPQ